MSRCMLLCVLFVFPAATAVAGTVEEANKTRMLRFYTEAVTGGNLDLINELVAEDFIEHETLPGYQPNREGLKQFFAMMREAFPDLEFRVEFMVAEGDRVAAYITMTGTHKGPFLGIPATGNTFSAKTIDIVRIVDGKAVEHWGVSDTMAMTEQLGISLPQPTSSGD